MNTTISKPMWITSIAAALAIGFSAVCAYAADEKVSITGEAKCGKCMLKQTKSCQNTVQAEKDGKMVTYYLEDNDVSKDLSGKICAQAKKVSVTGTVKETDGKMMLTATKIQPE
jgi:heme-binding NEAT domain protein